MIRVRMPFIYNITADSSVIFNLTADSVKGTYIYNLIEGSNSTATHSAIGDLKIQNIELLHTWNEPGPRFNMKTVFPGMLPL